MSAMTFTAKKKSFNFEDAHELFRQCKNVVRDGFSGKYISALQNFCNQRQNLIEERRRLTSVGSSSGASSSHTLSGGSLGVLAYFHSPETFAYPVIDDLTAQLESDIADVIAQLHASTTQITAVHKRLAEVSSELLVTSITADEAMTAAPCGYDSSELAAAALSMSQVCAEVRVWAIRTVADVRSRLVDPRYDGMEATVLGLTWWDAARPQPIDADKAWRVASDSFLTDVAKIFVLSGV
jgi:hypothetical protein